MIKPSNSLVGLLQSDLFVSGKGKGTDIIDLLKEQDAALGQMQREAEDIIRRDNQYIPIVQEHWMFIARLRVDFIGIAASVVFKMDSGTVIFSYPEAVVKN